jgi:hypothetical protein
VAVGSGGDVAVAVGGDVAVGGGDVAVGGGEVAVGGGDVAVGTAVFVAVAPGGAGPPPPPPFEGGAAGGRLLTQAPQGSFVMRCVPLREIGSAPMALMTGLTRGVRKLC